MRFAALRCLFRGRQEEPTRAGINASCECSAVNIFIGIDRYSLCVIYRKIARATFASVKRVLSSTAYVGYKYQEADITRRAWGCHSLCRFHCCRPYAVIKSVGIVSFQTGLASLNHVERLAELQAHC